MDEVVCSYGWDHQLIRLPDGYWADHNPSPDHEPCPDLWPRQTHRNAENCDRDDLRCYYGTFPKNYVKWLTPAEARKCGLLRPEDVDIDPKVLRRKRRQFWTDDRVEAMERVARLHCGEMVGKQKHHLFTLPSRQQLLGDLDDIDKLFPPEEYGPSEEIIEFLGDTAWWDPPSPPQRYLKEIYIARRPTVSLTPKGKAELVDGLDYRPAIDRIFERVVEKERRDRYGSRSRSRSRSRSSGSSSGLHPDYSGDYGDTGSPYRDGGGIDIERGVDFPGDKYELLTHRFGVGLAAARCRVVTEAPAKRCHPYGETPHGRVDYYLETGSGMDGAFEVVTDHNDHALHRETYKKTAALARDDIARTVYFFSSREAAGNFFNACYQAGYLDEPIPPTLGLDRMNKRVVDRYRGTGQNGVYAIQTIVREYNDIWDDDDFSLQAAKRLAF